MANKITNTEHYAAIANAIRRKNGETDTYTPAEMADAIGRIPQGGGYGYTLLGSAEFTVNTTSTTELSVGAIDCGSAAYTSQKLIYVRIRDKAGKRSGYYYGSDSFVFNRNPGRGSTDTTTSVAICTMRYSAGAPTSLIPSTKYGIYPKSINSSGEIAINGLYNLSATSTINGTFLCEVYALDWPDGISPFL
ncbi:MAG: hypothetical protein IJG63_05055 [Oscillospiraceae bacterium]|nr:hypothetical protein [Oscillospiraceae bacterium]